MRKRFFIKSLSLFIIGVSIPLLVLGSFSIIITASYITRQLENNNRSMLFQTREALDNLFLDIRSVDISIISNVPLTAQLKSILQDPAANMSVETNSAFNSVLYMITNKTATNRTLHSIYIYFKNPRLNFFSSNGTIGNAADFYDKDWFSLYQEAGEGQNNWTAPRIVRQYKFDEAEIVTLFQPLPPNDGVVAANISVKYVDAILSQLAKRSSQTIFVTNARNEILFSSDTFSDMDSNTVSAILSTDNTQDSFRVRSHRGSYVVSRSSSPNTGLCYIAVIDSATLYNLPNTLFMVTFLLLLLSFFIAFFIAWRSSKKNYTYLETIVDTFDAAAKGKQLPELPAAGEDIYNYILSNVIRSFLENDLLHVQLSEKKYQNRVLELLALQSQMNPHFIYNTLDTIYWKVIGLTGTPSGASEMLENLSQMLRYSLHGTASIATLNEELENARSYISIQNIRFPDKFIVKWQIPSEYLNCLTARLTLQPLLENCLKHALSPDKILLVRISASGSSDSGCLRITVTDNGNGISDSNLADIRKQLAKGESGESHIGLFNTNKRIRLTFGERYGITLLSKQNRGTCICIALPYSAEPAIPPFSLPPYPAQSL
jgi:two-component system sensor histidine kinase YesM